MHFANIDTSRLGIRLESSTPCSAKSFWSDGREAESYELPTTRQRIST